MLEKLGFNKNIPLEFNNKRVCGLWLIIIGMVIIVSSVFGGEYYMNPGIFFVGYYVGFFVAYGIKPIKNYLSNGSRSKFQKRVSLIAFIIFFILLVVLAGPFTIQQNWRICWLGAFLATGIHFLVFYFVHGKSMLYIALLCSVCAIMGMILSTVPFIYFGIIDGIIKFIFGVYLLFLSRPSILKFN